MIELKTGNILHEDAEAIVNTVNTVGVMGKGIALQFKKAYPDNYKAYKKACNNEELSTGSILTYNTRSITNPKYIINFPTKKHWKGKSKIEYIETGLEALINEIKELDIKSVALPPLGCGLGGLSWAQVYPHLEKAFSQLPDVEWIIFEPKGSPAPESMPNNTKKPRMTQGRAALLGVIDRYLVPTFEYPASLLEVQKLVYFLTAAGEKMNKVKFSKHHYGPYADVLRHVLSKMEGHFIEGYGDGQNKPQSSINLYEDAVASAKKLLENHKDTLKHIDLVANLVEGFETPYGMELLSTVHWVVMEEDNRAKNDPQIAVDAIHRWSDRKAKNMDPQHIKAAWQVLQDKGWFGRQAQV